MNMRSVVHALVLFAASAVPLIASASPACTKAPESTWLSETEMRQKIAAMGYKDIRVFKKTTTGCYEIYARTAEGRKAEVYFNPVDGSIVEKNED